MRTYDRALTQRQEEALAEFTDACEELALAFGKEPEGVKYALQLASEDVLEDSEDIKKG